MIFKRFCFAAACACACVTVWGQTPGVMISGVGTIGCGQYLEDRRAGSKAQEGVYLTWIWGYLAGYNLYTSQKKIQPPDGATVLAYLDKHCRDHPLDNILQGGMRMVNALGGDHARSVH